MRRDPGLQQERTRLAWQRTGLSVVAGALIVTRGAMGPSGDVLLVVGLLVLGGAWLILSVLRTGRFATGSSSEHHFDDLLHDGRLVAAFSGTLALLCVAQVVVSLTTLIHPL